MAKLTAAVREQGFDVHESTVRRQLKELGFSLQANRKTHERADHPDRDMQFEHIAEVSAQALAAQQPLVSVDCKKKELIGAYKNGGRELAPTGQPILVNTHDFIDDELGKAIPYGIYDVGGNEGWVSWASRPTPRSSRSPASRRGGRTLARRATRRPRR